MNIIKKFFSNSSKKNEGEELIQIHPDMPSILSSVLTYCPSNVDNKKVLKTLKILVNNNKDGDNSIFKVMAKIKESHKYLEKMHDSEMYSTEWISNYSKAMEALNKNVEGFATQQNKANEELKKLLDK
jgi:hypothetical protein